MALRKTGEIKAVDEQGNRHKIIKYTEFVTSSGFQSDDEQLQGDDLYRLATGETLNKISDTEFEIVVSGIKLRPE
jgi:hypothetical protein